jgi:hypothetical protein
MGDVSEDPLAPAPTQDDRVLKAILNLTNEVLEMRGMLLPLSRLQQVTIIAASSFLGGIVTNVVLWLSGAGTVFTLHR